MREDLFRSDAFLERHLGSSGEDERSLLATLGCSSVEALIDEVVPRDIRMQGLADLPAPVDEAQALAELKALAAKNTRCRSFIGQGYYGCITPAVIQRNVIENPGWYTAYTPYQAEISQGRLEALLVFQQMVIDLTGLAVANASLLDEATAAAEAMTLMRRSTQHAAQAFFIDAACHPQVIAVVRTRARWLGIELIVGDAARDLDPARVFGAHLQYPDTYGRITDPRPLIEAMHAAHGLVSLGSDLLALMLLKSPGELGADVALGSAQRFGVPPGFGGPHAAFMATRDEFKRSMPGRIIGVSRDAAGRTAYRMALQTREQHIRREKATSNICTAQALLANVAAFYAVWHGADGLARIARRANLLARLLAASVPAESQAFFDTLVVGPREPLETLRARAAAKRLNLRWFEDGRVGISFDESATLTDVADVAEVLGGTRLDLLAFEPPESIPAALRRGDAVLAHPVFHRHRTETEMMRYLKRLENKDLSLTHAMIPLGSCTMKLNAAAEMASISWPEFADAHPFAPAGQMAGTLEMIGGLEKALLGITGFARVSFQPNAGSQGEYAGLLAIRNYHASRGEGGRDVCLIPASAHGTNPASAALIGLRVVVVACDAQGNVDLEDLERKARQHEGRVAALMLTYPSTHGVFEAKVRAICEITHAAGAQVYMDGANLNALAGIAQPARIGADVCHINLHKTFCIPHGGGGPGMGPIAVAAHLAPYLPGHPCRQEDAGHLPNGTVGAAPFGSALILAISWMYLRMMGPRGIRRASELAILNANYVAGRLKGYFRSCIPGPNGPRRARVHPRPARAERRDRRQCRGRRQAPHRLRFPRADRVVPGGRHADGRAHRKRVEGRARPLLRGDDRDPRRAGEDPLRGMGPRRQPAEKRAAHRRGNRRRVDAPLQPRGGGLSDLCAAHLEILAAGKARGQRRRRPASGVHLPAGRRLGVSEALKRTPLHALHLELGARMVAFAGYEMPVQYAEGLKAEHLWTRQNAGLFDVSHMGQLRVRGRDLHAALERALPVDFEGWPAGLQKYSLLLNERGGIEDDLMVTRLEGEVAIVVNAACKERDLARLRWLCPALEFSVLDHALIALQGPRAEEVLPEAAGLKFMHARNLRLAGAECFVSRSGYTGEDGFEISVPATHAVALARTLLAHPAVKPVGLGARDTLRLEAALPALRTGHGRGHLAARGGARLGDRPLAPRRGCEGGRVSRFGTCRSRSQALPRPARIGGRCRCAAALNSSMPRAPPSGESRAARFRRCSASR